MYIEDQNKNQPLKVVIMKRIEGTIVSVGISPKEEKNQATPEAIDVKTASPETVILVIDTQEGKETISVLKDCFDNLFPEGKKKAVGVHLTACACCDYCPYSMTCFQCIWAHGNLYKRPGCAAIGFPAGVKIPAN